MLRIVNYRNMQPATNILFNLQNAPFLISTEMAINFGNLIDPPLSFAMLHIHNLSIRPVKVIRNKGYLLVEAIEGVADYSPSGSISTSN